MKFEIDPINDKILRILEVDARISNVDLAKRVGLSPSSCLRRVAELEQKNIIRGYRAIIDRRANDEVLRVFVTVGLSGHLKKDAKAFEQAMDASRQVIECHNISGDVEYLLKVEVNSLEKYKEFHSDILGTLPQVSRINSHFCLGTSKERFA